MLTELIFLIISYSAVISSSGALHFLSLNSFILSPQLIEELLPYTQLAELTIETNIDDGSLYSAADVEFPAGNGNEDITEGTSATKTSISNSSIILMD